MFLATKFSVGNFFKKTASIVRSFNSYRVRTAESTDIPFIRNCNIANLPENYEDRFYRDQLFTYPDLSLIVEDENENLVGYALGRILTRQTLLGKSQQHGHIFSVAVSRSHRGKKLANQMIDLLHVQFSKRENINDIDLFCRVSR